MLSYAPFTAQLGPSDMKRLQKVLTIICGILLTATLAYAAYSATSASSIIVPSVQAVAAASGTLNATSTMTDTPKGSVTVSSQQLTDNNSQALSLTPAKRAARLWNLQDADILSVIDEVSQETGKNFVVDPRVTGKISLVSSKPLRQGEVYQVFLSVLNLLGYSAIPSGNIVKIVPNMESGEQATRVATALSPGKGDEVVVRVVPLENVSAMQLIPVLRPLMPQWSNIASYNPGNVLVLLGRAANLERIITIIQDVDKASNNGIQVIPLHHASAPQVANVINNLQTASRASGENPNVSIAVDERSNSILLGGPKGMRLKMRVLISQLDAPSNAPSGNTEVIYLRYLQAKTLAPLLGKIAQNILGKDTTRVDMAMPAMNNPGSNIAANAAAKDTNFTNIQAEPNTNAVIITAPPALMQALKSVITKLDIRPSQVQVEAIIAEISESDLTSLGIQWGSVTPTGSAQPFATGVPTSFPNFGAGVVGIIPSVQIQAILSVLRNQRGVNILSTPSIVVLDNQKATIEIGQMVPTQTGQYVTPTGGSSASGQPLPFTTNDYKNVTLKLDVTPQINLGTSVRLKLDLKNDTLQNPQNPGLTPLINTSKIQNSVIIHSDDILVLGGLTSNANNENINKVPVLSSIPLVGNLFIQKTTSEEKKNLVVFIKPIILKNDEDGMLLTYSKYSETRSVQANFRDNLAEIGDTPAPTRLPPWKNQHDLPPPFATNGS